MINADYVFTPQSVVEYIRSRPELRPIFAQHEQLDVSEVSHGNLNRVFDVRSANDPTRTVIVKQAPPYLYSVGPSWSLDPARAQREALALQFYNEVVPQFTPAVLLYDPAHYVIVMQNLDQHITWRKALIAGQVLPHVARNMGVFLGRTLGHTQRLLRDPAEKERLLTTFDNPELCQMTFDYVFTLPFQRHDSNCYGDEIEEQVVALQQDRQLVGEVYKLREQFATCQQALIHGDLHTGSIMVSATETFVIDPEFIFVGPMSFDLGAVIGNLWLNYAAHEARVLDPQSRTRLLHDLTNSMRDVWQVFIGEMRRANAPQSANETADFDRFALRLLQDTAGMAACEILRRVIGTSGVADIRHLNPPAVRVKAARRVLNIGSILISRRHELKTIDQLIDLAITAHS